MFCTYRKKQYFFYSSSPLLLLYAVVDVASELVAVELGEVPSSMQEDAACAIAASTMELASSTLVIYTNAWKRFLSYCSLHGVHHLPAKVSTITSYFAHLSHEYLFSSVLTTRAAIKHFYSLRCPAELSPTDLRSVARVVRGLERATKKPTVRKEGVSSDLVSKLVNFLLPDSLETCCISSFRNATFFSVIYYASAR